MLEQSHPARLTALRPLRLALALTLSLAGCVRGIVTPPGAPGAPAPCTTSAPVAQSIFLIGDAGEPRLPKRDRPELVDPVLRSLHRDVAGRVEELGPDSVSVLFLGDNVYWDGLPPKGDKGRRRGERILEAQLMASEPAPAIFVLGNHDWHIEGPEGWDRAVAQRAFLERYAPRVTMHPPGGCAGPDRVDVGEHFRLVLIDPIGFRHLMEHPAQHQSACSQRSVLEAYLDLGTELDHPDGRHVALAMHHPIITAGPHGGHYTWKQHLFPLTDFWGWAWIPLPVVGSLYPISRQLGVSGTDTSSAVYGRMVSSVLRASRPLVPSLFIGGHEHSLQVHRDFTGTYYLVSGAGSVPKVDRVEDLDTMMLGVARPGYMRLDVHADGALTVTVLALTHRDGTEPIFHHCLAAGSWQPWRSPSDAPHADRTRTL